MAKQNEAQLDAFNTSLRANPQYQAYLQSLGINTETSGQAWRLSDDQRKKAAQWVKQQYGDLGKGMEIDISGNVNQNEGFGKQAKKWGPIAGAAAATIFGVPGLWGGVLGGSGGAAAGGAGAAFDALPAIGSAQGAANAASLGWTLPGAGGGMFGSLLGKFGSDAVLSGLGGLLGGASESAAQGRSAEANAARDQEALRQTAERAYFDAMLAREIEKRTAGNNAWKRTQQADFLSNFKPQIDTTNPYSRPIQGPGANTRAMASDPVMLEMLKRQTSGQYDPFGGEMPTRAPDFSRMNAALDPSIWEDIMGWGGAALKGYTGYKKPVYSNKV